LIFPFNVLLAPFAGLYWIGLQIDRRLRSASARKLPKPVISVGNLTVGGTGKTPLLIHIANYFVSRSLKPAVLTRGYAGVGHAPSADNDETRLLKRRCPAAIIGAGADRGRSAQNILAAESPDVFLLDDGFQHWPLRRDLDLVCIDATDPWGGGWLLPAGRLREERKALRRASAIIFNRMELIPDWRRRKLINDIESFATGIPTFTSRAEYQLVECATQTPGLPDALKGKPVIALSAIGNPRAFEKTLAGFGALLRPLRFRDHHGYTAADVARAREQARQHRSAIVTTEKDWMKIERLAVDKKDFFVLRMDLAFPVDEQKRLNALLDGALRWNN
jgi:tetraacyldisaccharide 4'-kinase